MKLKPTVLEFQRGSTFTDRELFSEQQIKSVLYDQAVVFSNPEEELIVSESELCIDYDVSGETDNDTGGDMPVCRVLYQLYDMER